MKKNDLLLIGAALAIALVFFGVWKFFFHGSGAVASVVSDGAELARLPLSRDTEFLVTTPEGESNLVVVKDGRAYVSEATCPDAVCIRTGSIAAEGEVIVCLPHKLIVTIEAEE